MYGHVSPHAASGRENHAALATLEHTLALVAAKPYWQITHWITFTFIFWRQLWTVLEIFFWIGVKWGILWGNYCHMTRRPVWFRFSIKLRKNIARVQNYPDIAIWNSLCTNSKMADTHSLSDWLSKGRYRAARAATNNPKTYGEKQTCEGGC